MNIKKEICMIFSTEEDYNEANKAINMVQDVKDKITRYEQEYASCDEKLRKLFNGLPFDKDKYNKLEEEEKRNVSRMMGDKTKAFVIIQVLKELLR